MAKKGRVKRGRKGKRLGVERSVRVKNGRRGRVRGEKRMGRVRDDLEEG